MKSWDFSRLETLKREKEAREDRDIEWQEVAEIADISMSTLIRYRRNDVKQPQFHVVMALCDYFDVAPSHFEVEDGDEGNHTGHQVIPSAPIAAGVPLQA